MSRSTSYTSLHLRPTPTILRSTGLVGLQILLYISEKLSVCVDMVSAWMAANRLQLNHVKTEVLWCSSSRRQHQVPTDPVRIGNTDVLPVKLVHDLGVYIDADADVTMRPTSLPSFGRVLLLYVRSGVCGVLSHVMPC